MDRGLQFSVVSPLFSLFLINLASFTFAGDVPYFNCSNVSYNSNGIFEKNIVSLFSQLSSATSTQIVFDSSVGRGGDKVYGQYMCLSYVPIPDCHLCVEGAYKEIQNLCPNNTEVILWKESCQVRYSKVPFAGLLDVSGNIPLANKVNASNVTLFRKIVDDEVRLLIREASSKAFMNMSASGQSPLNSSQTIYCLVQCTTDLTPQKCNTCLAIGLENLTTTFYSSIGARLLSRNCFLRYEIYNFTLSSFNGTSNQITRKSNREGVRDKSLKITLSAVAIAATIVSLVGTVCCWVTMKRSGDRSPLMDIETIREATGMFATENFLGDGGFGKVYKGILRDGTEIAVKRLLKYSDQGLQQFYNEARLIVKLQHKNLVRLLGFCILGEERLLVYEFMENGSLDKLLKDRQRRTQLDWSKRVNIIKCIAKGMVYLHQDSCLPIIHRDLKASNILLDRDLNPKISDFGIAKCFEGNDVDINTSCVIGTRGYMAPEYISNGLYSIKSDVYSFGVLLMEIITGNAELHASDRLNHVWELWNGELTIEMKDEVLTDPLCSYEFPRYMHIGLLCVQENSVHRPTMPEVVSMLNNKNVPSRRPERPHYASARRRNLTGSTSIQLSTVNALTIPR